MIPVAIALTRRVALRLAPDDAFGILSDVPAWSVLFPHTERVEPFPDAGPEAYLWTLDPMGPPGAAVQIVYACRYTADAAARRIAWTPVEGVGNARVDGSVALGDGPGGGSVGVLTLGAVFQIPAPSFVQPVVEAAVRAAFRRMVDTFVARVAAL